MMEEVGTVVEIKGKAVALVLCQKGSFCKHCASNGLCQVGNDNKSMLVEAHNHLGAKVGDRVRLVTSTKTFLQSSFMLYIVPLIALVIGAVAGLAVGEWLENGPDPNLLSAIIGVAFLVGSFLIIRVGTRALARESFMPQITQIVDDEDLPAGG
ncbi:SoxR reducing system RseC family protein [Desulfuromonas sp. AOP6]|uniref:SoxR reducing system RseC family protein n=1 Tax=Desulfuromonas sp. AOP6 TaxID=1566351 RepID=UPI00127CEEDC|nr:SoxR reducing system RseC family protein [Desulfuromonas sp. AOP6]BCA79684.1 hypothetical protein AOP6_1471 [Desulfuromonas sp. AOP6]